MNIEIRRLTPDLVEDYVHFFDTTPHATNKDEHKCYCVWWCNDDYEGKDLTSSPKKRRDYATQCIKGDNIQGYLAYCDDKVVGWCNANTKMDCFAIAPEMQRKGIAGRLVERICLDAAEDGFDFVEAYPNKVFINEAEDFMGPAELYEKSGFAVYYETEEKLVMRKQLK